MDWSPLYEMARDEKDKGITLHHLMSATSGWLTSDPPGRVWLYNNAAFTAAERVLARQCAFPNDEIAAEVRAVFQAGLGTDSWDVYHWDRPFDPPRHTTGPKLAIDSHLRDLAAWGQLWLDEGAAGGRQLIPAEYVGLATSRVNPAIPDAHYGYNWFLNDGQTLWPDAPPDAYGHSGSGTLKPSGHVSRAVLWMCPSLGLIMALFAEKAGLPEDTLAPGSASMRRFVHAVVAGATGDGQAG